jgi:hypothetical protein
MRTVALVVASSLFLACGASPAPPTSPAPPSRDVAADRATTTPASPPPSDVAPMLAEVSPANVKRIVEKLASFGTRHTLSDTTSTTRGIGAARAWIKSEMERAAAESGRAGDDAANVSFDTHAIVADGKRITRDVDVVNVVAVLPGAQTASRARRYYVMGHYDSRATDPNDATSDAPGANDDASGVAVVMELLRVMAKRRYDATLVFVAVAGEEQGLIGSGAHAKAARAAGLDVRGVLSNDIVGDPSSPTGPREDRRVRVFSEGMPSAATPEEAAEIRKQGGEGDSPSRALARFVADVAAWQKTELDPLLVLRPDRIRRGGDHLPFAAAGFAAVRFTTVDETYSRQHQNVRVENGARFGDVPEFVDADYLARVARVNGATLAHLANAPSTPTAVSILSEELGNDAPLRWSPSPEPDVAGYEILWRETTSATWQHAKDAGPATSLRLPLNKDDYFFGVRAYDKNGYRSPVAFARATASFAPTK